VVEPILARLKLDKSTNFYEHLVSLNLNRRLSKDYERLLQLSECFVYQAMTALILQRLTS
jgi:hypothetical protein